MVTSAWTPGKLAPPFTLTTLGSGRGVSQAYRALRIDRRPRLVLVNPQGTVSAVYQDGGIGGAALAMVERLLGPAPVV